MLNLDITTTANGAVLRFSGKLEISLAHALRDALAQQLEGAISLEIDLSAVASCDATALQLLYSARNTAAGRRIPLGITAISQSVKEASVELGLSMDDLLTH